MTAVATPLREQVRAHRHRHPPAHRPESTLADPVPGQLPLDAWKWLYHFTCIDHGLAGIEREGILRPNFQPNLGTRLVWLTDLDTPDRAALGLTSHTLTCDRTAARITVEWTDPIEPWPSWARRNRVAQPIRDLYEYGHFPRHWYVSEQQVSIVDITILAKRGDQ